MVVSELHIENESIKEALQKVTDPEIPVLSILDLGVVHSAVLKDDKVFVELTPTYTGCPAMDTMAEDIKKAILDLGYACEVKLILHPAWTTDWISEAGRKKLEAYGIAAPLNEEKDKHAIIYGSKIVKCTHCGSQNTSMISQFGSTACKALFKCEDCLEPFDYFKCLK